MGSGQEKAPAQPEMGAQDSAGAPTGAGAPAGAGAPSPARQTVRPMNPARARQLNTEALAYLGDAVYEQAIREMLLARGIHRVDRLHRMATGYVSATAQAEIILRLMGELTEDEQAQVRRWRNHRYHSKARHADPMTYKWATAFEALAGYFYLTGNTQRLDWLCRRAAEIIDGPPEE